MSTIRRLHHLSRDKKEPHDLFNILKDFLNNSFCVYLKCNGCAWLFSYIASIACASVYVLCIHSLFEYFPTLGTSLVRVFTYFAFIACLSIFVPCVHCLCECLHTLHSSLVWVFTYLASIACVSVYVPCVHRLRERSRWAVLSVPSASLHCHSSHSPGVHLSYTLLYVARLIHL